MDGRLVWEHYQEEVEEEFIGWKKEMRVVDEVREGCLKRFGVGGKKS